MRTKIADTEASRLRGSVKFGTSYVPDSHPTPFCVSAVFFLLGLVLVGLFVLDGGAAPALHLHSIQCNACITREGGGGQDSHPPHLG